MASFDAIAVVARLEQLMGVVLLGGTLLVSYRVLPGASSIRWTLRLAALLVVVGAATEAVHTCRLLDPASSWGEVRDFVVGTHPGRMAMVRSGLVLLLVLTWSGTGPRRAVPAVAPMLFVVLWAQSAVSHAAASGWMAQGVDFAHLLGASMWCGLLLHSSLLVLASPESLSQFTQAIPTISTLSLTAVVVLSVTGTFSAWIQVHSLANLFHTDYGKLLLLKVSTVGVVLCVAAANRWYWMPRLPAEGAAPWLQQFIRVETALVVLVLAVTAFLVMSEPPGP